jgi:type I restriction enzyme, S subunit
MGRNNNHWEVTTLGEICRRGGGFIQTGPFGSQLHASDYVEKGIPTIMPKNIDENKVIEDGISRVSPEDVERLRKYKVQTGDIVYSRRGDVTLRALIREQQDGWLCGTGSLMIRLGQGIVDPKFVSYFLGTSNAREWIQNHAVGATMPNLNTSIMSAAPIAHPPLPEQQKIAAVLSALDAKIELNQRINAELESMAKTLYDYWFVQFDFPNEKGKPYKSAGGKMVWNEDVKRELPLGWEVLELSKIVSRIATGLNPRRNFVFGNGNNYYVTIKNIDYGRVLLDDRCDKIDDEAMKIIDRRSDLQVGDILFTSIEPVGKTYLLQEKPTNWNINESVFTIRPNYELVTSEYLYSLLSSKMIKSFTNQSSAGSTFKGIRIGVLNTFLSPYSNKKLISDFSEVIKPILKKIDLIQKESQTLTELRDWLLPMLMNGQVKVEG